MMSQPEPSQKTVRPEHAELPPEAEGQVTLGLGAGETTQASGISPRPAESRTVTDENKTSGSSLGLASFGPYDLLEKLGQGGMGAVYKARNKKLDKLVAIKVLPGHLTRDEAAVARFEQEMRAVGSLEHPNIVRAMHADEHEGTHYLVMEFIDGQNLQKMLRQRGPLPLADACQIIRQAAVALSHAHQHGLVHRDIKPSNMLVSHDGQVKILDLGLARLGQEEGLGLTSTGVSLGTPDYMAPEQWADSHHVDERADLYSLGCTFFFLLTGRAPYGSEKHSTVLSKMAAHANDPIPSLSEACPGVPDEIDQIYQRLLAKSASDRLGSAAELATLLAPFCEGEGESLVTHSPTRSFRGALPSPAGEVRSIGNTWIVVGLLAAVVTLPVVGLLFGRNLFPPAVENPNGPSDPTPPVEPTPVPKEPATELPKLANMPFTAEEAKQLQAAWAKHLGVNVEFKSRSGLEFRLVPPGEYLMGSTVQEMESTSQGAQAAEVEMLHSEHPQQKVRIESAFYCGVYEVTQEEYLAVVNKNPSHFSSEQFGKQAHRRPVETVSWLDAVAFCNQLSQREGLDACYEIQGEGIRVVTAHGYRLPTEAEWEFAARAGNAKEFNGFEEASQRESVGWFFSNANRTTQAVGGKLANAFGLHDLHGNVWEWCQDLPATSHEVALDSLPVTGLARQRVVRGGSWAQSSLLCRHAARSLFGPNDKGRNIGLRIVKTIPVPTRDSETNRQP